MLDTNMVRNVAIVGHGNCGKTSLAEAMLFTAGKIKRLGQVDSGTASMDYEDEEIHRKISINSSFNNLTWNKCQIFLTDTPGDDNFLNDTLFATKVCDGAVFAVGAVLGVKGQTIKFADFLATQNLPTVLAITKMDRERADFEKTFNEIKDQLPINPAVIQLPIGSEDNFKGAIDLVSGKAYLFADDTSGKCTETDIPEDMMDDYETYRENLMESVAETDDDLLEAFLEEGELSNEQLIDGLKRAVCNGEVAPVTVCANLANKGANFVLDAIVNFLPSPSEHEEYEGVHPDSGEVETRTAGDEEHFSA